MLVYNYDYNGRLRGVSNAQESPLEPGVFLIPGNATTTAPPEIPEGFAAVYDTVANVWSLIDISMEEPLNDTEEPAPGTVAEQALQELEQQKTDLQTLQNTVDTMILSML